MRVTLTVLSYFTSKWPWPGGHVVWYFSVIPPLLVWCRHASQHSQCLQAAECHCRACAAPSALRCEHRGGDLWGAQASEGVVKSPYLLTVELPNIFESSCIHRTYSIIFVHPFRVWVQPSFHPMHQIFIMCICRSMLQIKFHNVYDPVCSITDQAILVCEPPHFGWLPLRPGMPYTQVFFPNPPPANRLTSSFGAFSSMDQVKVSTSSPAATLVPLLTRTLRCARRLGVITPQKLNKHDIERGSRIDGIDFYVDIMIL